MVGSSGSTPLLDHFICHIKLGMSLRPSSRQSFKAVVLEEARVAVVPPVAQNSRVSSSSSSSPPHRRANKVAAAAAAAAIEASQGGGIAPPSDDDPSHASLVRTCSTFETPDPLSTVPDVPLDTVITRTQDALMGVRDSSHEDSDEDSVSSGSEMRVRRAKRRRAANAAPSGVGRMKDVPDEPVGRASNASITVEPLAALARVIKAQEREGVSEADAFAATLCDPHARPWMRYHFAQLMNRLPPVVRDGGAPSDIGVSGNADVGRRLSGLRTSLPMLTREYQRAFLVEAGAAPNPKPGPMRPEVVIFPPCIAEGECILNESLSIDGMPERAFVMRALLFEDELEMLCATGSSPVRRLCVLCSRARQQSFSTAVHLGNDTVRVASNCKRRYYQDFVDCSVGYASVFVQSHGGDGPSYIEPLVRFSKSLLSASFDADLGRWRIDDSLMWYRPEELPAVQSVVRASVF